MSTIGMLGMIIGMCVCAVGWNGKKWYLFFLSFGLMLGGILMGIGANPAKDAPNGFQELVRSGTFIMIISILIMFALWYNDKSRTIKNPEKQKQQKEIYDNIIDERNKSQKERYSIDVESLNKFFDAWADAGISASAQGKRMQSEKGPQQDWAIAGGIASGLAGGAAGIATAIDVMNKNAEATERYHKQGKEMEIGGINAAIEAQKAKKELQNQKFDNFEYSKIDNKLLNELNISFDKINDYKTEFIEVNVKATVKKDKYKFPKTNEAAKIDGSFKVNLYNRNKTVLLASGYYVATGRRGNDKSLTGYNFVSKEKTILLKKQPNVKINLSDGYQIEFTDPKLWLLKI